ncbi:hypothetical protein FOC4_g10015136 [Fusarium odoratissimum]|uniref:Uncharacterized protein n=2 Tax=Fusarium oxysporum species complex TaxID=171631 RepID=N1R7R5_FUSC4|nr:hypothetical protein FOC4_g10015136 [Fusarium odoratissimum]
MQEMNVKGCLTRFLSMGDHGFWLSAN